MPVEIMGSHLRNDNRRRAGALGHEVDLERREWARRRPGDVAAGEVVRAAVAVAVDAVLLLLEADDAVEVRAGGRERVELLVGRADEVTGSAPKRTILKAFSRSSGSFASPASTSFAVASAIRGGVT
jgi:hypothetical protein